MREFFRPWRRKLGVMTLGLACLFVAGWIRSSGKYDVLAAPFGETVLFAENLDGRFLLSAYQLDHVNPVRRARYPKSMKWHTAEKRSGSVFVQVDRVWGKPSFQILTITERSGSEILEITFLSIPYWSIVVPLTLLTVCLLFSNFRAKPKQSVNHA